MADGKLLLKIASAVFMIFGVIAAIVSLIDLINKAGNTEWLISEIILLLANAALVITGAMGLKKSDDSSQANFFIAAGFAIAILELPGIIVYFTAWGLIGFLLPVFYIAGGYMLRKSEVR